MKRKFFDYTKPKKRRYPTEFDYDSSGKLMKEQNVYNPDNESQFYDYGGKPYNPDVTNWYSDKDITGNWHAPIIWNFPHGPDYDVKKRRYYEGFQVERVPVEIRQPKEREYVVRQPVETFEPKNPVEDMVIKRTVNGVPQVNSNKVVVENQKKTFNKLYKPKDIHKVNSIKSQIRSNAIKSVTDDFAIDYRHPALSDLNNRLYQRLNNPDMKKKVNYIVKNYENVPNVDEKIASGMLPYMINVDEFARNMNNTATMIREDQQSYRFFKEPITRFSNTTARIQQDLNKNKINHGQAMMGLMFGIVDYMNDINKEMIKNVNKRDADFGNDIQEIRKNVSEYGNEIKDEMTKQFEIMFQGFKNSMEWDKGARNDANWKYDNVYNKLFNIMGLDVSKDWKTNLTAFNNVVNNIINSNENVIAPRINEIHTHVMQFDPNPINERISQLEKNQKNIINSENNVFKTLEEMKENNTNVRKKVNKIATEVNEIKIVQSNQGHVVDRMLNDINTLFSQTRLNKQELERYDSYLRNIGSKKFIDYLLGKNQVGLGNDKDFFNTLLFLGEIEDGNSIKTKDALFGYLDAMNKEYNNVLLKGINNLLDTRIGNQNQTLNNLKQQLSVMNQKIDRHARTFNNMLNRSLASNWDRMDKRVQDLMKRVLNNSEQRLQQGRIINEAMNRLAQMDVNFKNFVEKQTSNNTSSAADLQKLKESYNVFDKFYTDIGAVMLDNQTGLKQLLNQLDLVNKAINMANERDQMVNVEDFKGIISQVNALNEKYNLQNARITQVEQNPKWSGETLTTIIQGANGFNENIKNQIYKYFTKDPIGINLFNSMVAGSLLHGQDLMHAESEPFNILRTFIINKQSDEMQNENVGAPVSLKDIRNQFWREVLNNVDLNYGIEFENRNDILKNYNTWTDEEKLFVDRSNNAYENLKKQYVDKLKALNVKLSKAPEQIVEEIPHMKALTYAPYYVALHHKNRTNEPLNLLTMIRQMRQGNYMNLENVNNWYKNLEQDPMIKLLNNNVIRLNDTPQFIPVIKGIDNSFNSNDGLLAHVINNYGIPDEWQRTPERIRSWIQANQALFGNRNPERMAFYGNMKFPIVVRLGNEMEDVPDYYRFGNFDRRNENIKLLTWEALFGNEIVPIDPQKLLVPSEGKRKMDRSDIFLGNQAKRLGNVNVDKKSSKNVNIFVTNQPIDTIRSREAEFSYKDFEAAANEVVVEMRKEDPVVHTGKRGRPRDNYDYYNQVYKLKDRNRTGIASTNQEDFDTKISNLGHVTQQTRERLDKWKINKVAKQYEKYPFGFK